MVKVNLVTVGTIKEKYFVDAIEEYKKRLGRFCSINIIEVKEETSLEGNNKIERETDRLCEKVKGRVFVFDRVGKLYSSEEFAKTIADSQVETSEISFVIGGSNGVNLNKLNATPISFGKITFPHQLFRVVAMEQIYRAFTIINGLPYHK